MKVDRTVTVLETADDFGFATKVSFVLAASDKIRDYNCFAPANWYRQNEFANPSVLGYDLDCEYVLYPPAFCCAEQSHRRDNFIIPLGS